MCVICKEWQAGKLTSEEAVKALGEMINSQSIPKKEKTHYWKALDEIMEKEVPVTEADEELDRRWHEETHEE